MIPGMSFGGNKPQPSSWHPSSSVKDGGSAKAPLRLHRGSAQGLGSLRNGCKACEEDSVKDKERVHVLGAVK